MNTFSAAILIVFGNSSSQFTEINNRGGIMVEFIENTFNINTQLKYVFSIKNYDTSTCPIMLLLSIIISYNKNL
jgi:hypothetical protein